MLSHEQRRRLEKERDSLQQEWDIRNDKLMRIRKTLAIETDPLRQFQYEQQIKNEENELKRLTDRLDEIEKQLQFPQSILAISKTESRQQTILVLTAIPHGLRLDREIREIEEAIRQSTNRDLFEIRINTAVRPQDIRRAIAEEQPQIVHFCGHGLEDGSLLLEDDGGNSKPVSPEGLAALFNLHADYVNCVLLNACHSEKTAIAISQYINYAIGMNHSMEDNAAIAFAQGFYDGLGYKQSGNQDLFQRAFNEGLIAIKLENISQGLIPILKKKLTKHERKQVSDI
ncbi:CHAT domain-containing protein [Nostoc punctiforme UO1]|uniref:CHAT domain-containing protein n=1 Tax=Nostoc punctiforme TaxID=272131 RepID=UPI0030B66F80